MASVPGVSVGALLRSRPEAFGLPLELVAGADGLDRLITSPHIQKTGLALAGFHEYLKPGRVLIFGESEIRYLESLAVTGRLDSMRLALTLEHRDDEIANLRLGFFALDAREAIQIQPVQQLFVNAAFQLLVMRMPDINARGVGHH